MNEGENKKSNDHEWKSLVQSFVTNMLSRMSDNISDRIQRWFKNILKRGAGLFLMSIGMIFVMVSIALYLNTVIADKGPWAGFGVVGVVACCVGVFMGKK